MDFTTIKVLLPNNYNRENYMEIYILIVKNLLMMLNLYFQTAFYIME